MSDLSAGAVERALDRLGSAVGRPVVVRAVTGSTSDDAREAAAAGAPPGAAFLSDAQTKGRGRGGHTWHSPPGENLYLSLLLRPKVAAASVAPVTLAIGVAVARVAEGIVAGRAPVWVKWPNDVLAGDRRKLAGVLAEGQIRGDTLASLVVGVGMNVRATAFPEEIAGRATSLALLGCEGLDRSAIAAEIIARIGEAVARFEVDRLASFRDDLARLDGLRGARVEVGGVRGAAEGIDAEGRLLVRGEGGVVAVVSGEVVVSA